MKYSLLKQLKDAGYPQQGGSWQMEHIRQGIDPAYDPNLSELIEACGGSIQNYDDESPQIECLKRVYASDFSGRIVWQASSGIYDNVSEGNTPEEAVANLWLAIHGKH